jgi:phi13 family phage major tail protein
MIIDMRHLRIAKYTNTDGVEAYSNAAVAGKAMQGNLSFEYDTVTLYADSMDQAPKEIIGGKLQIGTSRLTMPVLAMIGGHTYTEAVTEGTPAPAKIEYGENDQANEVGYGFTYVERDESKTKHYYAVFIPRVIFTSPSANYKTKGKSTEYQTPTIDGEILRNEAGKYAEITEHTSLAAALSYIDGKLGYTEPA